MIMMMINNNNNNRGLKIGDLTIKILDSYTTKDKYTWNITL